MKCDHCNKPAVVHEVTVRNGVKKEMHLCEQHAKESGIVLPGQQPINQLLTQFVISQSAKPAKQPQRVQQKVCTGCGLSFAQFKQTGRVGCAQCYDAFDPELGGLIERAQNGGNHHTGKAPKRAGTCIDRQLLIQRLVRELDHAVAAEQYERAAQLRDRLNSMDLKKGTGVQTTQSPSAPPEVA